MEDIRRIIHRARLWITLGRFARSLLMAATIGAAALLAILIAQRVFAFPMNWNLTWMIAGGAALVGAIAWTIATRPRAIDVARIVDDRAMLRESLSTALCVEGATDAWSKAAIETASVAARRVIVRQALPVQTPRFWPAPIAALVAFALCWMFLPQWDALGALERATKQEAKVTQVAQVQEQVAENEDRLKSMLAGLDAKLDEGELAPDAGAPRDPDEIRRSAIRRLTSVADQLADIRFGEDGQTLDELRDRLEDLRQPGAGPLDDLVQALQEGDFGAAKEALEALQGQLDAGALTPEQQKQIQEQMKSLAEQLEALAGNKDALENALEQAGMDPSLANDPQALQEALENNPNLSEQQKQQLQQQAQSNKKASEQLQKMSQCAGQCSNPGGMSQGMSGMSEQLSQAEMMAATAGKSEKAMQEALDQLGELAGQLGENEYDLMSMMRPKGNPGEQGAWNPGGSNSRPGALQPGQPSGGRGQGQGATGSTAEAAFKTKQEKASGKDHGGPIVGSMLVKGAQVKGEAKAGFADVVADASTAASEAIETNRVPREYHDAIKHYFGRLEAKAKAEGQPEAAPANESDAPASDENAQKP